MRFALRTLLRTPAFTLTAALTLALGIGATTAIFSVINAVLLEPLPYHDPGRLVVTRLSFPDYRDMQRAARSFEQTALWASNLYTLQSGDETRQVLGGVVSRELLPLLGVRPAIGRNFTPDDDRGRTVILGNGLWQSLYGGNAGAIGQVVELSGTGYTIIGVAPPGFGFPTGEFQLWTPMGLLETDARPQAENRALRIFSALGRLKRGVSLEQARGELGIIGKDLERTYPDTNAGVALDVASLTERLVGDVRQPLMMLMATVALLLLIACANVANLMLARASAREREMAIRVALGAGRGRLLGQLATESLVLAGMGGVCGLLLAMWAIDLLPAAIEARLPRADTVRMNGAVLLVAMAVTALTSLIFGLAPALQLSASGTALKERGVAGSVRTRRLRAGIVIAEVALAVIVVAGAGLLVRSFVSLTSRDPGFVPQNALSFNVQFRKIPDPASRARVVAAMMDRLAQLPGVAAAGGATGLPAVTPQRGSRFEIADRTLTPAESGAYFLAATPGYFSAVGTPVVRGRAFVATDTAGGQPVVLINRALAAAAFAGVDPVGRRLRVIYPEYPPVWRTIVGVVGDVQYRGLDGDMQPTVYTPFEQTPFLWLYVMVRTTADAPALPRSVRSAVQAVDPGLTAAEVRRMSDVVAGTVAEPRDSMLLVSALAALALGLAAIGIYGVIAYSVSQRTREIAVRMALGAARRDVLSMVVREGVVLAAVGVGAGLAGAALATSRMSELLVGVTPRDPIAFGAAAATLLFVAFAASYLPARRATKVEPMDALRAE